MTMADPTLDVLNDVTAFLGGCIMAMNISLVLYGVTTTQAYVYALHCQKDSLALRALVLAIWILETIHTACIFHEIWFYTIKGFGDFDSINKIRWTSGAFLSAETAVVGLVQGFYIRRIWLLSGRAILPTVVMSALLVSSLGFHIAGVVYIFIFPTWMEYLAQRPAVLTAEVANALFAAVDGLIAVGMIYYLRHHRSGFRRTDGIIRWLMGYIVNTGALTMLAAIAGIVTLATYHRGIVAVGVSTIVSKLYANALLGFLNARGFLQTKRQQIATRSVYDAVGIQLPPFQAEGDGHKSLGKEPSENVSRTVTVVGGHEEKRAESAENIEISV